MARERSRAPRSLRDKAARSVEAYPRRSVDYSRFDLIDGSHRFRKAVRGGYVSYSARRRHDGNVVFFNFPLARELGLIASSHPDRITPGLEEAILGTFCFVIINEHDRLYPEAIRREDILPREYMATRYLQSQHPDKRGLTSGDGRSVWNGEIEHRGITWDVSSCGTGVTCLCPATGEQRQFFATGSADADYGCGTATEEEGLGSALMSEIFHSNGIETERVLAVIATPQGQAINVRASKNLLRPAHMFLYSRQNDFASLEAVVDLFIDRQIANGDWPTELPGPSSRAADRRRRYGFFAEELARTFARMSASFESEYIFCWLDWDGDNILASGGIIDYGSVRQFGLYHRDYRFDDGPRWSTSIPEQRRKARHIAQSFAQIRDCLIAGKKPTLASLAKDPVLAIFDSEFAATRDQLLLHNIGFPPSLRAALQGSEDSAIASFRRAHAYFERAQSERGPHRTADGLTRDAIFSTRDLLRELPSRYLENASPIPTVEFMALCTTGYATRVDCAATPYLRRMARQFQTSYLQLVQSAAACARQSVASLLEEVCERSATINRRDRVTGDALTYATELLVRNRPKLSATAFHQLIHRYVELQTLDPETAAKLGSPERKPRNRTARAVFDALLELQSQLCHGL